MEKEEWVEDKSEEAEGRERTKKKNMNGVRRRIKTHVDKRNKITG